MSSRKRRHQIEEDDEDEIEQSRLRYSDEHHVPDIDINDFPDVEEAFMPNEEEEEWDEEELNQSSQSTVMSLYSTALERNKDMMARANSKDGEAGSIASVTLINFMCHENFHVDFSPRINFIVGSNGSGKSAILNAIVLGLGGRATNTSRGKSVTDFIRNKATWARITIKILNDNGDGNQANAFRIDDFGKYVVIERTLAKSGGGYKIKSTSGKVISDRREMLDDIITHFHIQVDNPICILNQEISRNFLNSNKPADKYKFFMKATLLEDLKNKYMMAEFERKESKEKLDLKARILPETQKDLKKLKRKVQLFKQLEENSNKLERISGEVLWAVIKEEQTEVDKLNELIDGSNAKINEEKEKIKKANANIERCKADKVEKLAEMKRLGEEYKQLESDKNNANLVFGEIKDSIRKKKQDVTKLEREIEDLQKDEAHYKKGIAEQEKRYSNLDRERNERQRQLEELTQQVVDLEQRIAEEKSGLEEKRASYSALKYKFVTERADNTNLDNQIARRVEDIRNLQASKTDRMRRFGQKIPELLQHIDAAFRNNKFKVKPLGPIGRYIELKDQSAAVAVERCLRNLLGTFCCDNFEDTQVLKEVMKKVYGNDYRLPSIITRKFKNELFDVNSKKVRSREYSNMLDLMIINEIPVANILIDNSRIETILYIPDYRKAMNMLINESSVPRNCSKAYTSDATEMIPQTQHSDFRSYPNSDPRFQSANILVENVDQRIQQLNKELAALKTKKKDNEINLREKENQLRAKEKDISVVENSIKEMNARFTSNNVQLSRLQNIVEPDPVEISTLKDELLKTQEKKAQSMEELESRKTEMDQESLKLKEAEKEMVLKKERYEELYLSKKPLEDAMKKSEEMTVKLKSSIEARKARINEQEEEIEKLKRTRDERLAQVEEKRNLALEKTIEPIETRRSTKSLEKEIEELKKFLQEQADEAGNKQRVNAQFEELYKRYKHNELEVKAMNDHLTGFKEAIDCRRDGYKEMREFYSRVTKYFFKEVLQHKGFTGSLEIYHKAITLPNGEHKKEKTLEIKVNPKLEANGSQSQFLRNDGDRHYNDTRSLSGGERSYSTVAFILALWESSHSPFKILDEVDVFMDAITRKISLDAMVEFAAQKNGKQYIFLTPLELTQLPRKDLVKVVKLERPEREQKMSSNSQDIN